MCDCDHVQVSPDLESVPGALMPNGPAKGSNLDNPGEGEYDKAYQSVKQIGEGAFGFVVFAVRKDTGDMVSTAVYVRM